MSWLKDVLRGVIPLEPLDPSDERPSYCGCVLPDGFWGDSGWHFTRYDALRLLNNEKWAFAKQNPGLSKEQLRQAWSKWLAAEEDAGRIGDDGVLDRHRTYLGLPVAVERCPAYAAAIKREQEENQSEQRRFE